MYIQLLYKFVFFTCKLDLE